MNFKHLYILPMMVFPHVVLFTSRLPHWDQVLSKISSITHAPPNDAVDRCMSCSPHLASSCILVFTTQMGLVKVEEVTPVGRKRKKSQDPRTV